MFFFLHSFFLFLSLIMPIDFYRTQLLSIFANSSTTFTPSSHHTQLSQCCTPIVMHIQTPFIRFASMLTTLIVHHVAPHHTTLDHTTPHPTTAHYTTSHFTTPHQATSDHIRPHHTKPHHTRPHHTTPHHTTNSHNAHLQVFEFSTHVCGP